MLAGSRGEPRPPPFLRGYGPFCRPPSRCVRDRAASAAGLLLRAEHDLAFGLWVIVHVQQRPHGPSEVERLPVACTVTNVILTARTAAPPQRPMGTHGLACGVAHRAGARRPAPATPRRAGPDPPIVYRSCTTPQHNANLMLFPGTSVTVTSAT